MGYATLQDLAARESLRNLAQGASPDHPIDADQLQETIKGGARTKWAAADRTAADAAVARLRQALTDAEAEIDGWIGARYPDLTDPPAALKAYAVDVAVYRLFAPGDPEDPRLIRYKAAITYLRDVSRGLIDLSPPAPDPDTATGVMTTSPGRVFTADTLRGY